ncbi:tripartite tricarboxylate transporter substrate-binding protein [Sulfitobacter mediterraneus]|uniref:tripartite tricarboxylate transporter substrate-binding protein n=1 Tax=Sulfitobacter mediterraneus TaxID=83219 RepID=UPI000468ECBF|nr:tripartite tricarboxylate transporter substrate-binding protein [Sulfitobacter mediterraneus]KIN78661.1 putative Tripartite Tricarboxylate Transporter (TTT) family protein, substrate binding protein [Sulfitobacter mediterraneus KCTC 32188]
MLAELPEKDITLIVPWSAGGGTDTIARTLVAEAESCLGANVNVVNRTGAVGASGMGATATARPGGYTIGLVTFELTAYEPMGMVDLGPDDCGGPYSLACPDCTAPNPRGARGSCKRDQPPR